MNATAHSEAQAVELATVVAQPLAPQQIGAPVAASDSVALIQAITAAAQDPSVDIEKMERLWAMRERIAAKDVEQAFNAAMARAQSEMGCVSTDAENRQTRSRYATYAQLDRHLRPIYTTHGFALSFDEGDGAPEGYVRVVCYVSHKAGHTRTYHCDIPADGKGARGSDVMTKTHAVGSGKSYGMRYMLKGIFNVAVGEDDDDGNAADGPPAPTRAEYWCQKVYATTNRDDLTSVMREGRKAFQHFKDRDGYTAFANAIQKHGATLPAQPPQGGSR